MIWNLFLNSSSRLRNWQGMGVCLGTLAAVYLASPYLALWDISRGLKGEDPSHLTSHIDWSAVSATLKAQVRPVSPSPDDDLPDFGSSFASTAISNAIDLELSPKTLIDAIHDLTPKSQVRPHVGLWPVRSGLHAHFVSLDHFETRLDQPGQTPLVVYMTFEHWNWKVTGFDLPQVAATHS